MSDARERLIAVSVDAERRRRLEQITAGPGGRSDLAGWLPLLVAGLHEALADPLLAGDPDANRHVHARVDLLSEQPPDEAEVTVSIDRVRRLGAGSGAWIRVDVDGPRGTALMRSAHVVQIAAPSMPADTERGRPPAPRGHATAPMAVDGELVVSAQDVAGYVAAAGDFSPPHAGDAGPVVVPGLLLLALIAHRLDLAGPVASVEGRFSRPVHSGERLTVASAPLTDGPGRAAEAGTGGGAAVRHVGVWSR